MSTRRCNFASNAGNAANVWLRRFQTAKPPRIPTQHTSAKAGNASQPQNPANEQTPVLQGLDEDRGLVMIAENQEPPFGLEPKTYALRKRRSTN